MTNFLSPFSYFSLAMALRDHHPAESPKKNWQEYETKHTYLYFNELWKEMFLVLSHRLLSNKLIIVDAKFVHGMRFKCILKVCENKATSSATTWAVYRVSSGISLTGLHDRPSPLDLRSCLALRARPNKRLLYRRMSVYSFSHSIHLYSFDHKPALALILSSNHQLTQSTYA